jgi:hypothetical protein
MADASLSPAPRAAGSAAAATSAADAERLWALHDFDAENPDEVSFRAGEPVIVVERDDAYGDGWWQVSADAERRR